MILRGIFHVVSRFPLHFMLYRGTLDYLLIVYRIHHKLKKLNSFYLKKEKILFLKQNISVNNSLLQFTSTF